VTHILPVLLTSTIKQCSFYQFCTVSVRLISTCSKAALGVELNFSLQQISSFLKKQFFVLQWIRCTLSA
ncbi:MAG: hypothetical protein IJI75_09480, partial [Solobacterium sp.]|nr:hypothetical protein [Solobacterium sp.]